MDQSQSFGCCTSLVILSREFYSLTHSNFTMANIINHNYICTQERRGRARKGALSKLAHLFRGNNRHREHSDRDNVSVGSMRSVGSFAPYRRTISGRNSNSGNIIGRQLPATPRSPPPQSETLKGFRSFFGTHQKQYTIASKKKYVSYLYVCG